jgi:hypothetical protein
MIGNEYWSTGITLKWWDHPEKPWTSSLDFFDDGFCDLGSTEGGLRLRYCVPTPAEAIDTLKTDAERLGITWRVGGGGQPYLYMKGDGEDPEWPPPPDWRAILEAEAKRIGWRFR